jgi:PAS domain S-box-containing protein
MDRDPSIRPVAIIASGLVERRLALRRGVEEAGFGIAEAATAAETLAVLQASGDVRLAFIDVALGTPGGTSTVDLVRALHPRLAVYVLTGEEHEQDAVRAVEAGARGFLFHRHLHTPLVTNVASGILNEHRLARAMQVSESAVLESEYRYRTLFGLSRDPLFIVDAGGTVIEANAAAENLIGTDGAKLVGRRLADMVGKASDRDALRAALDADADESDIVIQLDPSVPADAREPLTLVLRPRRDVYGQPNGLFCQVSAPQGITEDSTFALLFVEIAGIDTIEAPAGRPGPGEIARALSTRLLDTLREGDIVSRLGAEEFVVLLGEVGEERIASVVVERLRRRLSEPLTIGDRRVRLECSIGGARRSAGASSAAAADSDREGGGVVLLEFPRRRAGGTIVGAPRGFDRRGAQRFGLN